MIFFTSRVLCQPTWSQLTKSSEPVTVLREVGLPLLTTWASHAAARSPGPLHSHRGPHPGCAVKAAVRSRHAAFQGRLRSDQLNSLRLAKTETSSNSELRLFRSKLSSAQESRCPALRDLGQWSGSRTWLGALGLGDTLSLCKHTSLLSCGPVWTSALSPHVLPVSRHLTACSTVML